VGRVLSGDQDLHTRSTSSRRLRASSWLALLLLTRCVGDSAGEGEECPVPVECGCATPVGRYEISYSERPGGTCGPLATRTSVVDSPLPTQFLPPCSGEIMRSEDGCVATFEARCPAEDFGPGFTNRQWSESTHTADALLRQGTLDYTVLDAVGEIVCNSIYDVEAISLSCG
jgi:hypothetical protein